MAQVKFNRGQRSSIEALTGEGIFNQVSIGRDTTADSWDSIYLGNLMVGTSLLRLIKPTAMPVPTFGDQTTWTPTTPASGTSLVITADYNGTSAITTARNLVDYATASAQGYAQQASDSEILTAKAVTALVATVSDNTYYTDGSGNTAGGWNYNSAGWKTWTAVDAGTQAAHNISFTLPVEAQSDGGIVKHGTAPSDDYSDTLLPTSKAVAEFVAAYLASFAGGMRYIGSLADTTAPAGTKPGDVFIASAAISDLGAEANDMIVVNDTYTNGNFTAANTDVFERNLDGAVTKSPNDLTTYGVVYANGTSVVQSTAAGQVGQILVGQGLAAPTWLNLGTEGQTLMVKNTASAGEPASLTAGWADTITYTVDSGSSANIILVYRLKNGSVDTSYNETGWTNGIKTITINDVNHAVNADKVLEKEQTANTNRNLLVGYASVDPNTNATEYKDVEYNPVVTVNNAGQITAQGIIVNEYNNGTYTSNTSINVSEALTWHDLPSA